MMHKHMINKRKKVSNVFYENPKNKVQSLDATRVVGKGCCFMSVSVQSLMQCFKAPTGTLRVRLPSSEATTFGREIIGSLTVADLHRMGLSTTPSEYDHPTSDARLRLPQMCEEQYIEGDCIIRFTSTEQAIALLKERIGVASPENIVLPPEYLTAQAMIVYPNVSSDYAGKLLRMFSAFQAAGATLSSNIRPHEVRMGGAVMASSIGSLNRAHHDTIQAAFNEEGVEFCFDIKIPFYGRRYVDRGKLRGHEPLRLAKEAEAAAYPMALLTVELNHHANAVSGQEVLERSLEQMLSRFVKGAAGVALGELGVPSDGARLALAFPDVERSVPDYIPAIGLHADGSIEEVPSSEDS